MHQKFLKLLHNCSAFRPTVIVHQFISSFTWHLIHSFIYSFIKPLFHLSIYLFIHSLINLPIPLFVYSFIHPSILSFIGFIHSFIHSLFSIWLVLSFIHSLRNLPDGNFVKLEDLWDFHHISSIMILSLILWLL